MAESIHADRRRRRAKHYGLTEATVSELAEASISEVLDGVGDDPELARAALENEMAREKPRKTLMSKLEAILEE